MSEDIVIWNKDSQDAVVRAVGAAQLSEARKGKGGDERPDNPSQATSAGSM